MMPTDDKQRASQTQTGLSELSNGPANDGLSKIISSIIEVVTDETACLASNTPFDVAATNARKARLLHEFNQAARGIELRDIEAPIADNLRNMQFLLQQNTRLCQAHAAAVREITGIALEILAAGDSDGIYNRRIYNYF